MCRTEDEIGMDNLKEVDIPDDLQEKFKQFDDDDDNAALKESYRKQ